MLAAGGGIVPAVAQNKQFKRMRRIRFAQAFDDCPQVPKDEVRILLVDRHDNGGAGGYFHVLPRLRDRQDPIEAAAVADEDEKPDRPVPEAHDQPGKIERE